MADTHAMSSVVKALTGVLPDTAVRALMQALGNCTQPTTARAPADFQPNYSLGNTNGVYSGGRWNPAQYPGLLPSAGSGGYYDVARSGDSYNFSNSNSNTNINNYDGNQFFFPTNQAFNLNNFYGGPSMTVGGNSNFNNIVTNNITTNSITVTGGGGGGGYYQPPQQQPAAQPGDGGFGGGGGGGGAGIPGGGGGNNGFILLPPIGMPMGNPFFQQTRNVALTARGSVDVPTAGEIQGDCTVKLTNPRATRLNITVTPDFLKVFA